MEKLEKKKHDHNLTKWLKFGIFAIIMIAPFLSVLSKCVYVAVNKNAKQSYYGQTINEKEINTINNITELKENKNYIFNSNNYTYMQSGNVGAYARGLTITNFKISSIANFTINIENPTFFGLYIGNNNLSIRLDNGTQNQVIYFNGNQLVFEFTYISNNLNYNFAETNIFAKIEYNKYSYLSNVFEYSVDELNNNNLFNWSKQTAIYTAIYNMTNGLGANEVLAMLLAYWGILTAIYIVFDIVIECFTKLTHLLAD